ncbi:cytochrome P450 monooxygenase [Streptomyces bottropensis ATCC 25435]|uniref:Cytochrome P450 monooxygenase n=1 Tax=Streptomyces bottropensis ATCC 25435 TaxID=1054862 RepID=M3FH05_9ACTN|nr:cytochrome P450 monooxygenase [Streptomyces bottropensis ATCC 25435]
MQIAGLRRPDGDNVVIGDPGTGRSSVCCYRQGRLAYTVLPGLRTDPRRQEAWYGWCFRGLTAMPVTWD